MPFPPNLPLPTMFTRAIQSQSLTKHSASGDPRGVSGADVAETSYTEQTRQWQRLEKLLEDALIKVSSVASKMDTLSVRHMLEALIAGERDPRRLAELARGRMKSERGRPDRGTHRPVRRPLHRDRPHAA